VGLSATLPNYEDVAVFLRVNPEKGLFYYEYAADQSPKSMKEVADKCSALYNCKDEDKSPRNHTKAVDIGKPYDILSAGIQDIVENVNDLGKKPASMTPQEATKRITQILKANEAEMELFQKNIMESAGKLSLEINHQWGSELQSIFKDTLWEDKCFEGLTDLKLYKEWDIKDVPFWEIFARRIGYDQWGSDTCKAASDEQITFERVSEQMLERQVYVSSWQRQAIHITVLARGEIPQWKADSRGEVLKFQLLRGYLELRKTSGIWNLETCTHVQCKYIPKHADMTQLFIKGIQNTEIKPLLSGAEEYKKALRSMLDTRSGNTANKYKRGKELLHDIIHSLEHDKRTNFAALAKHVEADETLQTIFKRRSWIFLGSQSDAHRELAIQRSKVEKVSQLVPLINYFDAKTGLGSDAEFSGLQLDLEPIFETVEKVHVFSYQAPIGDQPAIGENVFKWDKLPEQQFDENKTEQTCLVELQVSFEMYYNSFAEETEAVVDSKRTQEDNHHEGDAAEGDADAGD